MRRPSGLVAPAGPDAAETARRRASGSALEHPRGGLVPSGRKGPPSTWYVTEDATKAYAFREHDADVVLLILRGEYQGEDLVYFLGADPAKRPWHVLPV